MRWPIEMLERPCRQFWLKALKSDDVFVCAQVGKQIGQNFVFENRGGAGTTLGSAMVAKADPDGYTLLVNSTLAGGGGLHVPQAAV